jgi:hypothetical protein
MSLVSEAIGWETGALAQNLRRAFVLLGKTRSACIPLAALPNQRRTGHVLKCKHVISVHQVRPATRSRGNSQQNSGASGLGLFTMNCQKSRPPHRNPSRGGRTLSGATERIQQHCLTLTGRLVTRWLALKEDVIRITIQTTGDAATVGNLRELGDDGSAKNGTSGKRCADGAECASGSRHFR